MSPQRLPSHSGSTPSTRWELCLQAFLHDPPSKACDIKHHELRRETALKIFYAEALKGDEKRCDWIASGIERVPFPSSHGGQLTVGPDETGRLNIVHPLSGESKSLSVENLHPSHEEDVWRQIKDAVNEAAGKTHQRYLLALWRLNKDLLMTQYNGIWGHLPADTRIPDHTIWQHVQLATALAAANVAENQFNVRLVGFSIGPVQSFIQASRSLRDLWASSMLLSYLTFRGIRAVLDRYPPCNIIYPSLHGLPLYDIELLKQDTLKTFRNLNPHIQQIFKRNLSPDKLMTPCIPNKFLALIDFDDTQTAQAIDKAVKNEWDAISTEILEKTVDIIPPQYACHINDIKNQWRKQTSHFLQTKIISLAFDQPEINELSRWLTGRNCDQAFPEIHLARRLDDLIPESDRDPRQKNYVGRWALMIETAMRVLASHKNLPHIPPSPTDPFFPAQEKCTLLGDYEQLGPIDHAERVQFWKDLRQGLKQDKHLHHIHMGDYERLSAIGLIKKLFPQLLEKVLNDDLRTIDETLLQISAKHRYPDTHSLAARQWLKDCGIDSQEQDRWQGEWLTEDGFKRDFEKIPEPIKNILKEAFNPRNDKIPPPPQYYAVIKLDGDEIGRWLKGEKMPTLRCLLADKLRDYFQEHAQDHPSPLEARRPLIPAVHNALSESLKNFAIHAVVQITERHKGTVIYSGGDDTLLMAPVQCALPCVVELYQTFTSNWWSDQPDENGSGAMSHLMPGKKVGLSAGICFAHVKDDLRAVLQSTAWALQDTKQKKRNAVTVIVRRRSGEHTHALIPWSLIDPVIGWQNKFADPTLKLSDRWAYQLQHMLRRIPDLPLEGLHGLARQVLQKKGPAVQQVFLNDREDTNFLKFHEQYNRDYRKRDDTQTAATTMQEALVLILTASFINRVAKQGDRA